MDEPALGPGHSLLGTPITHLFTGARRGLPGTRPAQLRRLGRRGLLGSMAVALAAGTLALSAPAATAAPTYRVTDTIDLGRTSSGDGMAFDPAHDALYVVNYRDDLVSVIDTTTNKVTATIPVGDEPFRIAIDPEVDRAYVSNVASNSVSVIDTSTRTVIRTLTGFGTPRGLDVDTSTHLLYVVNYWVGQNLVEVNPETGAMTASGYLESRPWSVAVDSTTHRAYATTLFGQSFSTVQNTTILDTMYPGGGTGGPVTIDSEKKLAYVPHGGVMSAIDISADKAVSTGTLPAGGNPTDVAIDKLRDTLYVSNSADHTVSVIDRTTRTRLMTLPVDPTPVAVEIDPASGRVYVLGARTVKVIEPRASQEITFTSTPPAATVGGTYAATATGGASGLPVTFSTTSDTCTVTATGDVSFDAVGDCVIRADQAGDIDHLPANATQTVAVGLNQTATTVALSPGSVVHGEPAAATATVTGTSAGSVQFSVDGEPLGSAVPLDDGTATAPALTDLAVGSHDVGAVFTPADEDTYATSSATPQALTVGQAATTTSLSVSGDAITANVDVVAPGAGQPTGTVRFLVSGAEVGSAPLARGTATLSYEVPAGAERQVSVVYDGDTSFAGSSASTARKDPVITAAVSSSKAKRNGWYSQAVKVSFRCEATTAALTEPCPAPVTLSRSAAGQSVTRTVVAADGGTATVSVRGINVDRVRPTLSLKGVRSGATYFATGPKATCVAKDGLSGVEKCKVTRTKRGSKLVYVATATDRAGNTRTVRRVARSASVFIEGASMKNGKFVVHRGRNYRVLVAASKRPTYIHAAPTPRDPAGGRTKFHRIGKNRWALAVSFDQAMKHHQLWNIGTKVGSKTTVTTVRVVK